MEIRKGKPLKQLKILGFTSSPLRLGGLSRGLLISQSTALTVSTVSKIII